MARSARDPNAVCTKCGTESTRARRLVVDHTGNEIILDDMITAAAEINTERAPCLRIVVSNAVDDVAIDQECSRRVVDADVDAVCRGARRNETLHPDRITRDHTVRRTLRRNADGINLIDSTCRLVANSITADLQTREYGRGRTVRRYTAGHSRNTVVVYQQISSGRARPDGRDNRSHGRR